MRDKNKTKEQLAKELTELLQQIAELEGAENERKKEVLRGPERELREVIDSVKDGIVLLDLTGKVTAINKSITEATGYAEEDVVGKRFKVLKMFPPKSITTMLTAFTRVISGQQPPPNEVEVYTRTGEKLFVEIHGSLLKKGGAKAGVIAALRDITERKQMETLLLRERETFVTILQHALYGVVLLDRDGKHVYVNPAFTEITGYTLEDIPTGRDWLHQAYPDKVYRQKVTEFWRQDSKLGGTRRIVSVVCKNGETKEIEFRSTVLDDGRSVVMLADVTEREREEEFLQRHREHLEELVTERTAALQAANKQLKREITERKQMQDELRESEERFKMLAENAPFGISIMGPDRSFKYLNPQFTKIFGYTIEDIPDKDTWFKKAYPNKAYRNKVISIWKRDTAEEVRVGEENPRVFTVRCKDGQDKIVDFKRVDLIDGKQYQVYEDITARSRAEEALRESEEKYRELINGMNDTAWVIDFDGKFIDVNDAAVEVLGYSREELLTMGPHDIDSSLDAENITGLIKRMRADKLQVFETTHTSKDGKIIPVEIKSSLVTYQGKQAILSIARDITERKQAEEALRESESRFRLLVEHSQDTILLHDFDGKIIDVNQHGCDSLGYTREELLGLLVQDIDQRVLVDKHQEKWKKMVPGEPITLEGVHKRKDGTTFPAEVRLGVLESGGRRLILGLVRDITERKQMEEALRESQQELQALMDSSPAAISWADLQGNIQYINRKHYELFGYTLEDIPNIDEWRRQADQDPTQKNRFAHWGEELMEAHMQGRSLPPREMTVTCKDGSIRYVTVEGAVVSNHNLVIYNDITERVRAEETIRKLAYHDALTGLPNRVLFADRLDLAMSQAHRSQRRLGVMLLDLDRFKNVNDTFGHSVGDMLLHSVGKRLTGLLRKNDTISRTGGDEFSLLMPEIDQEKDTVTVAQKVLNVFQEPFVLDVHEIHITTSIGIAIYPDDGEDADTLLKHSDIAMYQAKQKGRNNYQRYTPI